MKEIQSINNLRGVAVMLTLLAHFGFFTKEPSIVYAHVVQNVAQFWGGVELFFVISGFVISLQLDRSLRWGGGWVANRNGLKEFYIKRFYRIFPQAFFWATIVIVSSWYFAGVGKFGDPYRVLWHYLAAIASVENIYLTFDVIPQLAVYWSLSIEEQFYLVFPLILTFFARHQAFKILLFAMLLQLFLPRRVDQSSLIFMMRYDALLLGYLIYCWAQTENFEKIRTRMTGVRGMGFVQISLLVAVVLIPVWMRSVWFMVGILDIFCAAIVALAVLNPSSFDFKKSFFSKVTKYLGSRSYAIYLCHMPVAFFLLTIDVKYGFPVAPATMTDIRLVGLLGTILACAELSYRLIENPLRDRGRSIAIAHKGQKGDFLASSS